MKKINGKVQNLNKNIIGCFLFKNNIFTKNRIIFCKKKPLFNFGIIGYIVPKNTTFKTNKPIFACNENAIPFSDNDIISITPEGVSHVLWEANSIHNGFYVTDVCNSKCIMCPQIEGNSSRYEECIELLKHVKIKAGASIGITGGEPTINIPKLINVINAISDKAPNCNIHILTNGRNFSIKENVEKILSVKKANLSYGIPLYSDISEEHDYIVGVPGAFNQTIKGIYNLGKFKQKIEIRIVVLRQNYKKLKNIIQYIYRNIPFVTNISLMSMEYHGNAQNNYEYISIDPYKYKNELYEAVKEAVRCGIMVDVYNTPLCLVDERIESFCRDSISTWKKTFNKVCENCTKKNYCSGLFETSFKQSEYIKPFI